MPITPCTKGPYIYAAPEQDIAVWVSLDSVVVGGDQIFSISFLKGKDQIVPPPPAQVKAKAGVASFPVHMRLTPDANGEIVMEVKNPDAPGIGATYTIQILQPVVNP